MACVTTNRIVFRRNVIRFLWFESRGKREINSRAAWTRGICKWKDTNHMFDHQLQCVAHNLLNLLGTIQCKQEEKMKLFSPFFHDVDYYCTLSSVIPSDSIWMHVTSSNFCDLIWQKWWLGRTFLGLKPERHSLLEYKKKWTLCLQILRRACSS